MGKPPRCPSPQRRRPHALQSSPRTVPTHISQRLLPLRKVYFVESPVYVLVPPRRPRSQHSCRLWGPLSCPTSDHFSPSASVMHSLRHTVCFGVWGLRGGCVPSPALRPHSNQLTTSRARLEKSPLGRGLRRNNSSRLPSTPPPTATPSALLRVFTVLTLARNSSVMSTAMAPRTYCPRPSRPTSAAGDDGASPAAGGLFRLCTPPPANRDARRKVPAPAG